MQASVAIKVTKQVAPTSVDAVVFARQFLAKKVDEALSQQIAYGNNQYTISVDNNVAYSRNAMYFVKRNIKVSFAAAATAVAVDVAKKTLARAIRNSFKRRKSKEKFRTIDLSRSVTAWLCEKGVKPIKLANSANVSLANNQWITITAEIPRGQWNPMPLANWIIANSRNGGIYLRAARSVQRKLGLGKGRGSLRCIAQRIDSPHTFQPISQTPMTSRPIDRALARRTNWVLIIRNRPDKGQILRN